MKLKDIISFLTFSNFADEKKIELQFSIQHNNYQSIHSYWSINATKRKLITEFWYNTVIKHYLLICSIALFGLSIFKNKYLNDPIELIFAPISISFVFIPVAMFVYFPSFYNNYLPLLENCAESFTGKQLEGIQKCKREQYSVMSLMLIQHILQQLAGIHNLSVSEQHTNILMKQYGVSQKMIDTTLRTILFNNWDNKKERKRTEIIEAFDEAKNYFDTFHAGNAIQLLEKLQQKMLLQPVKESKPSRAGISNNVDRKA